MKKLRSRFAGIFLSQGITTPFNMPAIDKATPMLEGAHYGYTTADQPMQPLNQLNFVRKLGEETRSSHPHTNVPIVCSVKYIIINVPMLHTGLLHGAVMGISFEDREQDHIRKFGTSPGLLTPCRSAYHESLSGFNEQMNAVLLTTPHSVIYAKHPIVLEASWPNSCRQ
jgi:hypothetical protein